ncbi:AMP-binding protein [Paremcibacter congregatus]|uniref:AMP-binding protein n=1 Tax=Paremcibacter congregatus TaxID=2043170 RepID=UPI003A8CCDE5
MKASFKKVDFPPVELTLDRGAGGEIYLESASPTPVYEPNLIKILMDQASRQPEKTFLAMRRDGEEGWDRISYGEAWEQVLAVGQWLINQNLAADQSMLLLSENAIEHAILTLAGLVAGVPVCPISPNYSLLKIYARLDYVVDLIAPAVVYADDADRYRLALDHIRKTDMKIITRNGAEGCLAYLDICRTPVSDDMYQQVGNLDPDKLHKLMLTSGSTGLPKAVMQTSRMQAANAAFCSAVMAKATSWREETLDWLPWNHVSGALVQTCVMLNGGTLYIDDGKPLPGLFEKSLRNMAELKTSFQTNIPLAYELLATALEKDKVLRQNFFRSMRHMVYGGAGISSKLYERFQKMAVAETGHRLLFGAGYGATETASGVLATYFESEGPGVGLPQPGVKLKLVPVYNGFEIRVAGPTLTPGYFKRPDLNEMLLDDEGYYSMGDVVDWVDPDQPEKGLKFIGRLSDEFKLASGTWVNAHSLKESVRPHIGHLVTEFILCGANREGVRILAWPNSKALAELAGEPKASVVDLSDHPMVVRSIQQALADHNRTSTTSSRRIAGLRFLLSPPDAGKGELTDKGTVNSAALLNNRAEDVERLYDDENQQVILI